jgi:beta-1,4-mannosyl-glycoprotein beta-1,4-N-acetylglucosaminyltransferase
MKIFDVFLFCYELDLLEIRLNLLYPYVDYFLFCESEQTHSGLKKELYYQNNKHLFKKFEDKIIYNVIDSPTQEDLNIVSDLYKIHNYRTFQQDAYEKDSIKKVLEKYCSDDDIIIWSDIDEVPNPEVLLELKSFFDPTIVYNFAQDCFQGYLNWIEVDGRIQSQTLDFEYEGTPKWIGTKMCSYSILKKYTLTQMRRSLPDEKNSRIYPGGWHWSTVGSPDKLDYADRLIKKIKSTSHQDEMNKPKLIEKIPDLIAQGRCPIHNSSFATIEFTEKNNFPKYLLDNQEKYSYLIKK